MFEGLRTIVVDELHGFAKEKRGDLLSLSMSRLQTLAPGPAPGRPVGDDQRSRRLSLLARARRRHGAGRPRHRRSRRRAGPFDPDPREPHPVGRPLGPPRRARGDEADRAAQDDARLLQHPQPRRADLPGPVGGQRPGAADRHPPRQPGGRGAAQGRGGDGGGQAARAGRDRQPRPRHRLGRRRPGRPDGRAEGQLAPAAADRPRQPPPRRAEQGHHRPRQPLRISRGARRARRDRRRRARPRDLPPRRARRARPAHPGDGGRRAVPAGRAARRSPLRRALRRAQAGDVRGDPQFHRHRRLCAQGLRPLPPAGARARRHVAHRPARRSPSSTGSTPA